MATAVVTPSSLASLLDFRGDVGWCGSSFVDLPSVLLLRVATLLDDASLASLSATCTQLRALLTGNNVDKTFAGQQSDERAKGQGDDVQAMCAALWRRRFVRAVVGVRNEDDECAYDEETAVRRLHDTFIPANWKGPPWPRVAARDTQNNKEWVWRPSPLLVAEAPSWRLRYAALRRADVSRGAHHTPILCFEWTTQDADVETEVSAPAPEQNEQQVTAATESVKPKLILGNDALKLLLQSHTETSMGVQRCSPAIAASLDLEIYANEPWHPHGKATCAPSDAECLSRANERWADAVEVPPTPCTAIGCKRCAVRRMCRCAQHPPPPEWLAFHGSAAGPATSFEATLACGCPCQDPSGLTDARACVRHGDWIRLKASAPPRVHLRCLSHGIVHLHISEDWPAHVAVGEVGGRIWLGDASARRRGGVGAADYPEPQTVRVDWVRSGAARRFDFDLSVVANFMRWALPPIRWPPRGDAANDVVQLRVQVVEDPLYPHRLRVLASPDVPAHAGARLVLPALALAASPEVQRRRSAESAETRRNLTEPAERNLTSLLADMALRTPDNAGCHVLYGST